ncbi:TRAP transporter large permease [Desulfobaculum bizertense]|uniref:TRAP transporter, DctM subunit n=1 Tax=Desulfobaculum bizertense DSM 18034 TaxID=1121442 RepID=A0A1T4X0Q5_9BACT|nr:TRAP transporter large permease [Desulfobaculum bizertense]UIJ37191.1 TRAP transporter large permease [Desulfobaculum bizertense]SKA83182.1 TRAP transporter, DctM subunit [Desulfobaculum bizertense DSM 18034]
MSVLLAILALLVTLFIGVPIPFAFFASAACLIFLGGYQPGFLLPYGFAKMNSVVLLTIPLFIMAGGIMDKGGIGDKLVDVVDIIAGRIKGGLGVVCVVTCAIFGAVSGSSSATVSCIGSIIMPKLQRAGYPVGHTAALLASSGVLGILIPPSMLMIVYAWLGNQSVLACFLAAFVPGIILTILLSLVNLFLLRNNKDIEVRPADSFAVTGKKLISSGASASPALMMPVIILGGIYGGIMTPTEAAAVAVLYAIPVAMFFYKGLKFRNLGATLIESATTTGVIMAMTFAVMILSRLYIMENLPEQIMGFLTTISDNKMVILLMINVVLLGMGMLMDDVSGFLLGTPILLPLVQQIGVDPLHFAAIMGVNLGMGNVTPPTAPLLYLSGRISGASVTSMLKPTMYLILFAWLPTLLLTTYVPDISLFLVRLLLK